MVNIQLVPSPLGRCKQKQHGLRGLLCRWPSITEWEMYVTAQGPRLRNDLYCVEWDTELYYTIPYHYFYYFTMMMLMMIMHIKVVNKHSFHRVIPSRCYSVYIYPPVCVSVYSTKVCHAFGMHGVVCSLYSGSYIVMLLQHCASCGLGGCKNRPAPFPGRMSYKATKPGLALSVVYLILACFIVLLFIRAPFINRKVSFRCCVLSFGCSG